MADASYKSMVPASSRFDDLEQLVGRLDTIQPASTYRSSDLISRGLFTIDFLRDDRIVYQNGLYIGAQVIHHFAEHNAVDNSRYPQTIDFQVLSGFFDVRLGTLMRAVGSLLDNGMPVLENGKIKAPYIYDVYTTTSLKIAEREIVECIPMVDKIALGLIKKFGFNPSIDVVELKGSGYVALVETAGRYNPFKGVPFKAYAMHRIRGGMMDYMRSNIPGFSRSDARRKIKKAESFLSERLQRPPTEEETAAYMGIDLDELAQKRASIKNPTEIFIDHPREDEDEILLAKIKVDTHALDDIINEQTRAILKEVVMELEPRLRTIIAKYYYDGLTLAEIGNDIGLCESRISQLRSVAIGQLRQRLTERLPQSALEYLN